MQILRKTVQARRKGVTLSGVPQNLIWDHRLEYLNISGLTQSALVKRSAYAKLEWRLR